LDVYRDLVLIYFGLRVMVVFELWKTKKWRDRLKWKKLDKFVEGV